MTSPIRPCKRCGRRPSERVAVSHPYTRQINKVFVPDGYRLEICPDATHDLADLGPEAVEALLDLVDALEDNTDGDYDGERFRTSHTITTGQLQAAKDVLASLPPVPPAAQGETK